MTQQVLSIPMPAGKPVTLKWLPLDGLVTHPRNPRIGRPDKLDAIIESMTKNGYRPEKPMLVRPYGEGHQIIGGHSRHAAAKVAGLKEVFCAIEEMDDETAILRIGEDNINDPLPWYAICLYVFQNAVKDSKQGLSRTRLVTAATGKDGQAARHDALRLGDAGEVIAYLIEAQCSLVGTLLDPDKTRTRHLVEIKQASRELWPMLAGLLVEHEWSVKDAKSATDRIKSITDAIPSWWPYSLNDVYPRAAIEPAYAKSVAAALVAMGKAYDSLPEKATIYRHEPTGEIEQKHGRDYERYAAIPHEEQPRVMFRRLLDEAADKLSAATAEKACRHVMEYQSRHSSATEEWRPVLSDEEERDRQFRMAEIARLTERETYMPKLLKGDVVAELKRLPSDWYDLICIDPPYNMDKAEWDSYGSGQEFAKWSRSWLKECKRVLKDSGALYVFGINRMLSHLQGELDALDLKYRNWIIWDTIQGAGGGLWVNRHEAILYYSKTDQPYEDADSIKLERHEENVREYKGKEYAFKNPSNVWRFPCVDDKHEERTAHPTQKPVELIARIVKASSPQGGRVLDCFIGSGTTGVACMRNRRLCTGIDSNDEYLQIAQSRFDSTEIGA